MATEPLHEFQVNGKQLVFLFMSATVVAVVVFLAGVMVGRGVRSPETIGTGVVDAPLDPTADPSSGEVPAASSNGGASDLPVTAQEDFTYGRRLVEEDPAPVEEPLRPVDTRRAAPAVETVSPAPPRAAPRSVSQRAVDTQPNTTLREPPGNGYVVQVAATRQRSEADAIARRLSGKGYPVFVTTPSNGPRVFRVRIGKYKERSEALTMAAKLEREEQFKPWVTR